MCGNIGLLLLKAQAERDADQIDLHSHLSTSSTDIESPRPSTQTLSKLLSTLPQLNSAILHPDSKLCEIALGMIEPIELIESMAKLTEMRGGQSAGLASIEVTKSNTTNFFRDRNVVTKRGTASATMVSKFKVKSFENSESVLLMGHLRFATSSRNKVSESHPHLWEPWKKEFIWHQSAQPNGTLKYTRLESTVGHTLTHNGDFDAVQIYTSPIPMKQCGLYFERILHTPSSCDSDSNKIAGYFDLFETKGRWGASCRRAWVLSYADNVGMVCDDGDLIIGASNSAPPVAVVGLWGKVFDEAFGNARVSKLCSRTQRDEFITAVTEFNASVVSTFADAKHTSSMDSWTMPQITAFVSAATEGFLTADTFSTMSTFLKTAHGSFGLAVMSATENGAVVLSASGQPMCFAVDPMVKVALYGSESNAIRIPVQSHGAPLRYRYNINDHAGEVVRIGQNNFNMFNLEVMRSLNKYENYGLRPIVLPFTQGLTLCFDALGTFQDLDDVSGRFVLQPRSATVPSKNDLVLQDIHDIPNVLREITLDWGDAESPNRKTASDLVHLLTATRFRHYQNSEKTGSIDLLITGIESSLWLGEQLSADLKLIFPRLNCIAVSANKLLGSLENVPRSVHFCGYNRIRGEDLRRDRPVVLCLSQSGQTFATLHVTRQLLTILGGNVFLVTGDNDSKMRQAVSDSLGKDMGDRRVMCNLSGLRVAEASTVASCAMHHTLTELLLHVGQCACVVENRDGGEHPETEMSVDREDLIDFRDLVDSIHDDVPELVYEGNRTNTKLRTQGQYWAKHVTENWRVNVICGLYILVTVISGYPIFTAIVTAIYADDEGVQYAAKVLDALLYIFLPKIVSYTLRIIEHRAIFARHGKRTLVVCDVPWVHEHLENYVSKLFALSYGPTSLDVHSACAHDDMVHCFTHRVTRGTLLALGRPDGRVLSLLKTEQTIMLAAKQAAFIENMGCGPEFATVGHNNVQSSIASSHVCIPSNRRKFLSESLYDFSLAAMSQSLKPEDFKHATKMIMASLYAMPSKMGSAFPRRLLAIGYHHASDADTDANGIGNGDGEGGRSSLRSSEVDLVIIPDSNDTDNNDYAEEVLGMTIPQNQHQRSVGFAENLTLDRNSIVKSAPIAMGRKGRSTSVSIPKKSSGSDSEGMNGDPLVGSKHATAQLSLDARYAFTSKLPTETRRQLDRVQPLEHLFESRVASFERYISFLVMFHSMVESASKPWLLPAWDISRSQSNLRVATTACPVSVEEDDEGEEHGSSMHSNSLSQNSQHGIDESQHTILENKKRYPELSSISEHFPAAADIAVMPGFTRNVSVPGVSVNANGEIEKPAMPRRMLSIPSDNHHYDDKDNGENHRVQL